MKQLHNQHDVLADEKTDALSQPIKNLRWEFIESVEIIKNSKFTKPKILEIGSGAVSYTHLRAHETLR